MKKTLTFKDGTTKEVLLETVIYPSNSATTRSKLEVHGDTTSLTKWVTLFSDEDNLMNLTLTLTDDDGGLIAEDNLTFYIVLSDVGKKLVEKVNASDGSVTSEYHNVAVLEQLTETEQKLWEIEHANSEE